MKKYLKPNVVIEPLINRWHAWPHLVSPATAAMNIVNKQMPIMESYISDPEIHISAVLDPAMLGGPFMDFGGEIKIDEVRRLKDSIERKQQIFEFAEAIKTLDKLLIAEKGFSLEKFYEKVPVQLKGLVELYYDRNNNAGFRFFEPLLYQSEFYDKQAQSIALWITENDHRPFCFSTPNVQEFNTLHLNIPFEHTAIDALSKMKRTPADVSLISELLGVSESQHDLFATFFTDLAPAAYEKYEGDKIRMRYFGHACILLETRNTSILIDPLVSYYGYFSDVDRFSDADIPEFIDYVLITHNHQDHILLETILPLRHRIKNIIVPGTTSGRLEDPDLKLMLENVGFTNVIRLNEMSTINFADVHITAIPFTGEHCDLNIMTKACYHVQIDGFKLLFFADSKIIEPKLYERVHRTLGNVDVVFLGMECDGAPLSWLYGPLLVKDLPREKDITRRMSGSNCAQGMALVDIFRPREMYVYAMGQEPWVEFITSAKYNEESNPIIQSNRLINSCSERGIIAERLFGEKEILYDKAQAKY